MLALAFKTKRFATKEEEIPRIKIAISQEFFLYWYKK
jgi:hypothetical protein